MQRSFQPVNSVSAPDKGNSQMDTLEQYRLDEARGGHSPEPEASASASASAPPAKPAALPLSKMAAPPPRKDSATPRIKASQASAPPPTKPAVPPSRTSASRGVPPERVSVYSDIEGLQEMGQLRGLRSDRRRTRFRATNASTAASKNTAKYVQSLSILEPSIAAEALISAVNAVVGAAGALGVAVCEVALSEAAGGSTPERRAAALRAHAREAERLDESQVAMAFAIEDFALAIERIVTRFEVLRWPSLANEEERRKRERRSRLMLEAGILDRRLKRTMDRARQQQRACEERAAAARQSAPPPQRASPSRGAVARVPPLPTARPPPRRTRDSDSDSD